AKMPPHVVGELLRSAVYFPSAANVETLVIHEEDPAGRLALPVGECRHVDSLRSAVDRVRARIAGLLGDFIRLEDTDDLRIARIGLDVEDVDARGAQAGYHQIAPLRVCVRCIGAKAGAAGVPAEMV